MTTTQEKVKERIDTSVSTITEKMKEILLKDKGTPQMLVFYDENGESHMLPPDQQEILFTKMPREKFKSFVEHLIKHLKHNGVNIIESAMFQCVYYKMAKPDSEELKKHLASGKKLSETGDSDEALMVIRETPDDVTMTMYGTIFSDDGEVVVSEEPIENNVIPKNKSTKDFRVESHMIGFIK